MPVEIKVLLIFFKAVADVGRRVLFSSSWPGTHDTPSNELDLLILLPGRPW